MTSTNLVLPENFNDCMTACFTKMGTETRNFVINSIRIQFNELINSGQFNIEHYIEVINHLVSVLDGDDSQEGFQQFITLVNDVNLLKQEQITQQQIISIVQSMFASSNLNITNNFVTQLVTNQDFINQIKSSTTIINSILENLIVSLNSYLSVSTADSNVNQFVAILNQLINSQVVQINQNITTQVTQIRNDFSSQVNQVSNNFVEQVTQINNNVSLVRNEINGTIENINNLRNELTRINILINNCSTKDDLNNIRQEIAAFNQLRSDFFKLQIDVNNLLLQVKSDSSFYSTVDISNNTSILNLSLQLNAVINNITEINNKISQLSDFASKKDLAAACAAACEAFVATLNGRVLVSTPVIPVSTLKATFFTGAYYDGQSVELGVGSYTMDQIGLPNDYISSLKVPQGLMVTLYEHPDYQGDSRTYSEDCSFTIDFNDKTSSIVIKSIENSTFATGFITPRAIIEQP